MSQPSVQEILDSLSDKSALYVVDDAVLLAARVEMVLTLHTEDWDKKYGGIHFCSHCSHLLGHGRLQDWPCPTVRILNEGRQ